MPELTKKAICYIMEGNRSVNAKIWRNIIENDWYNKPKLNIWQTSWKS